MVNGNSLFTLLTRACHSVQYSTVVYVFRSHLILLRFTVPIFAFSGSVLPMGVHVMVPGAIFCILETVEWCETSYPRTWDGFPCVSKSLLYCKLKNWASEGLMDWSPIIANLSSLVRCTDSIVGDQIANETSSKPFGGHFSEWETFRLFENVSGHSSSGLFDVGLDMIQ